MDLKEAKLEDLQKENPDLVECIRKSVMDSPEVKDANVKLAEANKRLEALELKEKQVAQGAAVSALLKESKLPEIVKGRIAKTLGEKLFTDEKTLKEAFETLHKEELEFVNQLSPKGKIKMSAVRESEGNDKVKDATAGLMERMGIKEEKEEDKE